MAARVVGEQVGDRAEPERGGKPALWRPVSPNPRAVSRCGSDPSGEIGHPDEEREARDENRCFPLPPDIGRGCGACRCLISNPVRNTQTNSVLWMSSSKEAAFENQSPKSGSTNSGFSQIRNPDEFRNDLLEKPAFTRRKNTKDLIIFVNNRNIPRKTSSSHHHQFPRPDDNQSANPSSARHGDRLRHREVLKVARTDRAGCWKPLFVSTQRAWKDDPAADAGAEPEAPCGSRGWTGGFQFIERASGLRPGCARTILRGLLDGPGRQRAEDLAEKVELDVRKPFARLSRGNRQKVLLVLAEMRAACSPCPILLLDEPFTGLDTRFKRCGELRWEDVNAC